MSVGGPRGWAGDRHVTLTTLGEYAVARTSSGADGAANTLSQSPVAIVTLSLSAPASSSSLAYLPLVQDTCVCLDSDLRSKQVCVDARPSRIST